jgi:hypothetical protein
LMPTRASTHRRCIRHSISAPTNPLGEPLFSLYRAMRVPPYFHHHGPSAARGSEGSTMDRWMQIQLLHAVWPCMCRRPAGPSLAVSKHQLWRAPVVSVAARCGMALIQLIWAGPLMLSFPFFLRKY